MTEKPDDVAAPGAEGRVEPADDRGCRPAGKAREAGVSRSDAARNGSGNGDGDGDGDGANSDGASDAGSPAGERAASRRPRGRIAVAAVLGAVLIAIVAFAGGWLAAPRTATPSDTSAEAGFARDMQQHHDQAVQMAMIIRTQTDDPDIRRLAYDIATSQSQQSGQMYAWLNLWGLPQASTQPAMTWMLQPTLDGTGSGHEHGGTAATTAAPTSATGTDAPTATSTPPASAAADGSAATDAAVTGAAATGTATTAAATAAPMVPGGPMPGMASAADIARLSTLTGVEAERLFLQLMIAHHLGGVEMAEAVIARSTNPDVVALAKSMAFAQTGEIEYMRTLLAARGA
ncbi:DUF305 domain-containing protein [Herbiconiux sp. 11R-BC]|uniref:DUF305 domain-containing protein n=1 Tax=Herbiconiux sp. 11R-BC TaxID=3111637 RepID=UPI003C01CB88